MGALFHYEARACAALVHLHQEISHGAAARPTLTMIHWIIVRALRPSWTSIADMAWIGKSAWFPLMLGGTWKFGLTPLRFWPGGEAANPDASHPVKARE